MTFDPRIEDLLARYPDELSDAELAELRAAAEADPELEDRLDAAWDVEAALRDEPRPQLSDLGRRKLDRLVAAVQDAPDAARPADADAGAEILRPTFGRPANAPDSAGTADGPTAWSTGGATPGGGVVNESSTDGPKAWSTGGATPGGGVVNLADRRRRRNALFAIAAALLLAAPFAARQWLVPDVPDYLGVRGLPIAASLQLWGDDGQLPTDATRCATDPVFVAVDVALVDEAYLKSASGPLAAHLALVEEQNGQAFVVYPPPDGGWTTGVGLHWIESGGLKAPYTPGGPGAATYTIVGSMSPLVVPEDRAVGSAQAWAKALTDGGTEALTFPSRTVLWDDCRAED